MGRAVDPARPHAPSISLDSLDVSPPIDDLTDLYEQHHAQSREHGEFIWVPERIPFFRRALAPAGKRILDLGCRTGAFTRNFLDGNQVVGLDVDRTALNVAAGFGIEPVLADIEAPLPFDDESFDAVIAGEVLEHVRFPEAVLREVQRVLRPGGVLVGSVPNVYNLRCRLWFLAGRPADPDPTHLHMFSPTQVAALVSGFDDVEIGFFGGKFSRVHPRLLSWDIAFTGRRRPSGPT